MNLGAPMLIGAILMALMVLGLFLSMLSSTPGRER
jgi:hypothetical protein